MKERNIDIESVPYAGMVTKPGRVLAYTVTGRYGFPHDMLRRDRSWPANESNAILLDTVCDNARRDPSKTYSIEIRGLGCTPERWASFGWKVSRLIEYTT